MCYCYLQLHVLRLKNKYFQVYYSTYIDGLSQKEVDVIFFNDAEVMQNACSHNYFYLLAKCPLI